MNHLVTRFCIQEYYLTYKRNMEIINSSLLRRFSENLYDNHIKLDGTSGLKSPRKYTTYNEHFLSIVSEVTLLKDLDVIRKLGNDTRVYSRRVQLGHYKCWICSTEDYEVRYTRKARLDEHLELHPTGN